MNICGGLGVTSTPCNCKLARVEGSARALFSAAFSLATAASGVPAGALIPHQALAYMPGSPVSAEVITSGRAGERLSPMTARAFSRSAWICGNAETSGSKITWS